MPEKLLPTFQEKIFWSYANLAMAHSALTAGQTGYNRVNYMIRSKLYKGLMTGTMDFRSLFDDEKIKLHSGPQCSYCGSEGPLALDHVMPKVMGGIDTGDNLLHACRSCNSSKGGKDLMAWMTSQNNFPPLMILRRYLKLVLAHARKENLLQLSTEELLTRNLPFDPTQLPIKFPPLSELKL
ncbi:HNH endonuclease [Limnospira platensis]|uniref:HNH endonuclease n=4 Tax=Limnospira TaxID=2596745 RepID=UPI001689BFDD|nr:HNH endonuclease [Arthrospira platensis FACHB-835]